ncbi:hypothetical protein FNF28_01080 [Cafeteria roenbergensis]|uniref:Uncharacterized protein n=1 Tax=Cafeteria roenbergensis TaxID=33653 RepID=A0A5A8E004_CAFRO|nr:hypothetical protein FNF28_01080 [Cafeteria roenbergensis]
MRILQDYRLVSATVMVDYLRESLTEDEALGMAELRAIRDGRRVGRDARGRSKDLLDLVSDDLMKEDEETRATRKEAARASTTATGGHTAAGDDGGDGDGDEESEDDDDDDGGGPLRVSIVEKMRLRRNPDGTMVQPEMRWTRTDVEAAIEATHDTVNVKDTVGLMLKLLKQQPREPPNGRYSHLIGRWMQFES